jgi:RNA 2',3'-cyclic 3'-phosphodiesterase
MQQPGLGFDEPARTAAHNLFFALWPDEAVRVQMEALATALDCDHHPRGRLLKPARYHLTLQFLGEHAEVTPQLVEDAMKAAGRVQAPAFDLSLDRAGSFHNVWWLGSAQPPQGLQALWQALSIELMHARVKVVSPGRFTPHVTVVRDAAARLPPTPVAPIEWRVREFVLIDSQPPRPYTILHRWPLQDAG